MQRINQLLKNNAVNSARITYGFVATRCGKMIIPLFCDHFTSIQFLNKPGLLTTNQKYQQTVV